MGNIKQNQKAVSAERRMRTHTQSARGRQRLIEPPTRTLLSDPPYLPTFLIRKRVHGYRCELSCYLSYRLPFLLLPEALIG